MPTGERPLQKNAIDFVGPLPESEGFNVIRVVTDQLTKVEYYIAVKTTCTAENVADTYINDIWRLYEVPRYTSSDPCPLFATKYLKDLNQKFNINLCLSIAYDPQTAELTKRAVRTLQEYLGIYCHDRQIAGEYSNWLQNFPY